ncbi:MAG: arginine--tRNA ligase domain-containing protein, partial [Flavisolibacter sp.]
MGLVQTLKEVTAKAIEEIYKLPAFSDSIQVNQTKPEFSGDYTVVLFNLVKQLKQSPEQAGNTIGKYLVEQHNDLFISFNVIKGFLNLTVADNYFNQFLQQEYNSNEPGKLPPSSRKVIVEYSSPNTNKPLHLGHLRNNFLGWSVAEILNANGNQVMKTCIVNDRGIHICKSMIAWQLFANGATPESTGIKGDHFVGDYYVKCETRIKEEAAELSEKIETTDYNVIEEKNRQRLIELSEARNAIIVDNDKDKEKVKKISDEINEIVRANTPIMKQAHNMLLDWEKGDKEVINLWKKMNGWVYRGFDATYKRIGSDFDKVYYESETYLL